MPSGQLILDLMRDERSKRIDHFDALDGKAGTIVGFAAVLIVLTPSMPLVVRILASGSAVVAAGVALAAFWPSGLPILDQRRLAEYATSEAAFTERTLIDTLELMDAQAADVLRLKADRLGTALVALSVSGLMYGVGVMLT